MSRVRQNFHNDCEKALNTQINVELHASYVYLSMAYYFDRSDVALEGFHKYFKKCSDEEREHAIKLMTYQNKRGGTIHLMPIESPPEEWTDSKSAVNAALTLEKDVNKDLLELHALASTHSDPHLMDFLETEFLTEQVNSIHELATHLTNIERVSNSLGEFIFDKELAR